MSSLTANAASSGAIDTMVFELFNKAAEAILQGRKGNIQPICSSPHIYSDYNDYIHQSLQNWKRQLIRPITIDLYIFHSPSNSQVLFERWQFSYKLQQPGDIRGDNRPGAVAAINLRIQTLIRSLYCFIRLLPGFNLLLNSAQKPTISFQIYEPNNGLVDFKHDFSRYNFPQTSTSKGSLSISVLFITPVATKEIVKSINGESLSGVPISSPPLRRDSKTFTAAIPIPPPTYQEGTRSRTSSIDSHGSAGKDQNRSTAAHSWDSRLNADVRPSRANSFDIRQNQPYQQYQRYNSTLSSHAQNTPSQACTPPFAYGQMPETAHSSGSNSIDAAKASPPYYFYPGSLNATPPLGGLAATMENRRQQHPRRESSNSSLNNLINPVPLPNGPSQAPPSSTPPSKPGPLMMMQTPSNQLTQPQPPQSQQQQSQPHETIEALLAKVSSIAAKYALPQSPFVALDNPGMSDSISVPCGGGMQRSYPANPRLGAYFESDRAQQRDSELLEGYRSSEEMPFARVGEATSVSLSVGGLDGHHDDDDEEMPFAWRPSGSAPTTSTGFAKESAKWPESSTAANLLALFGRQEGSSYTLESLKHEMNEKVKEFEDIRIKLKSKGLLS